MWSSTLQQNLSGENIELKNVTIVMSLDTDSFNC